MITAQVQTWQPKDLLNVASRQKTLFWLLSVWLVAYVLQIFLGEYAKISTSSVWGVVSILVGLAVIAFSVFTIYRFAVSIRVQRPWLYLLLTCVLCKIPFGWVALIVFLTSKGREVLEVGAVRSTLFWARSEDLDRLQSLVDENKPLSTEVDEGIIELECINCRDLLRIPVKYAGTTGKCNKCGASITVPVVPKEAGTAAASGSTLRVRSGIKFAQAVIIMGFGLWCLEGFVRYHTLRAPEVALDDSGIPRRVAEGCEPAEAAASAILSLLISPSTFHENEWRKPKEKEIPASALAQMPKEEDVSTFTFDEPSPAFPAAHPSQSLDIAVSAAIETGVTYYWRDWHVFRGDDIEPFEFTGYANSIQEAAKAGSTYAQLCLAGMYLYGEGVPKNFPEARRLLGACAESGDAEAQYCLGNLCFDGDDKLQIPQDSEAALAWYLRSAEKGYGLSQLAAGEMLSQEQTPWHDKVQAYMWLNLASNATLPSRILLSENGIVFVCSDFNSEAGDLRDALEESMTVSEIHEAQRLSLQWKSLDR